MAVTLIFLDANIFLYAIGAEHAEKAACQAIVTAAAGGKIAAMTSVEVVQELVFVLDRRGRRADGIKAAEDVLALVPAMLTVTPADMRLACNLLRQHAHLRPRDAVHVATMQNNGIKTIASVDRHFDGLPGIHRRSPADVK